MSRELIEFSNLIDEQFEPAVTETAEFWQVVINWFSIQPVAKGEPARMLSQTSANYQGELEVA